MLFFRDGAVSLVDSAIFGPDGAVSLEYGALFLREYVQRAGTLDQVQHYISKAKRTGAPVLSLFILYLQLLFFLAKGKKGDKIQYLIRRFAGIW